MKSFLLLSVVLCLFTGFFASVSFADPAFDYTISYDYYDGRMNLYDQTLLVEGAGVHDVGAYGNSYIEIQNTTPYEYHVGGVGRALLFDQSAINIYGGESNVTMGDNSSMNLYGGTLRSLIITDNSSATFYGGSIGYIRNSQSVSLGTEIDLEIVCQSWSWDESTNHITGIWGNYALFDIELMDTHWEGYSEVYRMIDHIRFTIITDPGRPASPAHWAFDETSGTIAYDSIANHDGTLVGGPVWVDGIIGGAVSFDGMDDYVEVTGYTGISGTQSRTCSAWINAGVSCNGAIVNWGQASGVAGGRWKFMLDSDSGALRVAVAGGYAVGTMNLRGAGWHHAVAVLTDDGAVTTDDIKFYVDGQLDPVSSVSSIAIGTTDNQKVSIGAGLDGAMPLSMFAGKIDDLRIYGEALTDADIQFLYDEGMGFLKVSPSDDFAPYGDVGGPFSPMSKDYLLTNAGDASIDWDVQCGDAWLDASSASGTLSPGSSSTVTVIINSNADTFGWGEYDGAIIFRNVTDPVNIRAIKRKVKLDVNGPIIGLSGDKIIFDVKMDQGNPADQTIVISNTGVGGLNWVATESCDWLTVDPASGSSTGEDDDVALSVDVAGLLPGIHNCVLSVSDPLAENNPQTIAVTLRMATTLYVPAQFLTIQSAIDAAIIGDTIHVASGTYYPTYDHGLDIGNRGKHFRMKNGVTIKGGYSSLNPDERNIELYETILSGDIGTVGNDSDNSYHVFYHPQGTYLNSTAILDGFTIKSGNARGSGIHGRGAGMFNRDKCNPTITNCRFTDNYAYKTGGGMYNYDESCPTVTDCIFTGNYGSGMFNWNSSPTVTNCTFTSNSASFGGGMTNYTYASPIVTNCTFTDNSADIGGGGMMNDYSSNATVTNCIFSGNFSGDEGGGMWNGRNNYPTITNCTFSNNSTDGYGGGMYNNTDSSPIVTNCTFVDNIATSGNSLACDSYRQSSPNTLVLTNCILWDSIDGIWNNDDSEIIINHSNIQGGWDGDGNIDVDPEFVDSENGDLHLLADSVCIDAGDNSVVAPNGVDLDGNPRIDNCVVDMGAYEFDVPLGFSVAMSRKVLWPLSDEMVEVTPLFEASDNCGGDVSYELVGVTCNQPSEGDIEIDGLNVYLRAKRLGMDKAGRVYTITYKATDEAGNEAISSCEVKVRHDMGRRRMNRLRRTGLRRRR